MHNNFEQSRVDVSPEHSNNTMKHWLKKLLRPISTDLATVVFADRGEFLLMAVIKIFLLEGRAIQKKAIQQYFSVGLIPCVQALKAVENLEIQRFLSAFLGESTTSVDLNEVGANRFLASCWSSLCTRML